MPPPDPLGQTGIDLFTARYGPESAESLFWGFTWLFFVVVCLFGIMAFFLWRQIRAIEKAHLKEKLAREFSAMLIRGMEQERSRIARELHDTFAQDICALVFKAPGIGEEVNALIATLRQICGSLAPVDFWLLGLIDALKKLCAGHTEKARIDCRLQCEAGLDLAGFSEEKLTQIYRIVQEALNNAAKHAQASEVVVSLRYKREEGAKRLLVCITDDGKGFDAKALASAPDSRHFGLWSMKERARLLGGALRVLSESGEGAIVALEVPAE
jgi:signal transduction histidine kinase